MILKPLVINGDVWRIVRVKRWDPVLVDRMGSLCIATTDPSCRCIFVSEDVMYGLLDHVMVHEATHACLASYGISVDDMILEEQICNFTADHAAEILQAVQQSMPRSPGYAMTALHGIIEA